MYSKYPSLHHNSCDIEKDSNAQNNPSDNYRDSCNTKNITLVPEFKFYKLYQSIETALKCPTCNIVFNVVVQIYDECLESNSLLKDGFVFCSDTCSHTFKKYKARKCSIFYRYKRSIDDSTSVDTEFLPNVSVPANAYIAFTLSIK